MIKSYNPRPFEQSNPLPGYVAVTKRYELLAHTKNGYVITLAKLTIGQSLSAGNPLTHVLFESFSDHGERMVVTRTRVGGQGGEFIAVLNAMIEARNACEASSMIIKSYDGKPSSLRLSELYTWDRT